MRVAGPTTRLTEGGRNVAYAQVRCGRQNGKPFGLAIFFKAIAGEDALYVISRQFQTPASDDGDALTFAKGQEDRAAALLKAEAVADQYLANQVFLCAAASDDVRCK